jgi:hypothetical protein
MALSDLEAQRQQLAARLDKLNAPAKAAALAQQELAELDEQIAQARAAEAAERGQQMERDRQLSEARQNIAAVRGMFDHPWITDPEQRKLVPSDNPIIRMARKAIYGTQLLREAGEDVPAELIITLKLGD